MTHNRRICRTTCVVFPPEVDNNVCVWSGWHAVSSCRLTEHDNHISKQQGQKTQTEDKGRDPQFEMLTHLTDISKSKYTNFNMLTVLVSSKLARINIYLLKSSNMYNLATSRAKRTHNTNFIYTCVLGLGGGELCLDNILFKYCKGDQLALEIC